MLPVGAAMLGQAIGGYQLVAKLGEGGMGVVYVGEHRRIARKAAIKLLRADLSGNPEMLERFFNEARATSMIRHPGIVEILDCDVLPDGDAYIVMELLEGESLASALKRGVFEVPRAIAVARQIAEALAAAHASGIVHRDLKPDNVFLVRTNAGDSVKILDFGIAKLTNPELVGGQRMTHTGRLLGTPTYMSPEQCRGARDIDGRTDVYALGCILFELVTGRPPFAETGFGELVMGHLTVAPPRLRTLAPAAPPALDDLVARMLAKAAAERPQTMPAVVAELGGIGGAAPATRKVSAAFPATVRMVGGPRIGTPPVGAPSAGPGPGSTIPLPPAAPQTTLRSVASEHVRSAATSAPTEWPDADPRPGRGRRLAVPLLVLATVGAAGGIGYWRLRGPASPAPATRVAATEPAIAEPPPAEPAAPVAAAEAEPVAAVEPKPVAAVEPKPVADAEPKPLADAEPKPVAAVEPKPVPSTVKITITSTPSDADICLVRDNVLLGRTRYEWNPGRGSRVAKLWVRKSGYHAQQIVVSLDHDSKKHVELTRLGPDDIADLEGCRR